MLASGLRFSSKALVIVLLDLEERYVMTADEAKNIADPTARMLMRIKALRQPLKWIAGNSDELALIQALGAYGLRLVDPVAMKIQVAREAARMRAQLEVQSSGSTVTNRAPVAATNSGSPRASQPAEPGAYNGSTPGIPAGYQPEPLEAGAFIIPGYGIGFTQ